MVHSVIDQVKLAMMDGISARIRATHANPQQCANATGLVVDDLYKINSGEIGRFSMHRLVMIAEMLGAKITVTIE